MSFCVISIDFQSNVAIFNKLRLSNYLKLIVIKSKQNHASLFSIFDASLFSENEAYLVAGNIISENEILISLKPHNF